MISANSWNDGYDNYYNSYNFNNFGPRQQPIYYPNYQTTRNVNGYDAKNYFVNNQVYQKCHCTRLKLCQPIVNALIKAPKPLSQNLIWNIRDKSCGYAGNEPLICCPIEIRHRRNSYDWGEDEATTTEKPWVWDVDTDTHGHDNEAHEHKKNSLYNRFNYDWEFYNFKHMLDDLAFNYRPHHQGSSKNPKKKFFFFDFEDPRTFRNCPPSFSDEFELPEEFKDVKPVKNYHPIRVPMDAANPSVITEIRPNLETNLVFSTGTPPAVSPPTAVDSNTLPADKLALINSPSCGVSINTRIIGGEDAGPGQFPW